MAALALAMILLLALLPSGALAASVTASGECGDGVKWSLDSTGLLTVSGTGKMTSAPWLEYGVDGRITKVIIRNGVTSIMDDAFIYCSSVTDITIPSTVTAIGERAFAKCRSLTEMTIPEGVTSIGGGAFESCMSLESVTIPDSVKTIGAGAFYGCSSLTEVEIPLSVESIGDYAFNYCSGLTSMTVPAGVASLGKAPFCNCFSLTTIKVASGNSRYCSVDGVLFNKAKTTLINCPAGKQGAYTIPSGVTTIGDGAFCSCSGLTSVTIPDSVTSIENGAFQICTGLTKVTLPSGLTGIAGYTFAECSGLTGVTIPSGVTSIGEWAFEGCSSMTKVTIPAAVTSIEWNAFFGCSAITDVTFQGTQEEWKSIRVESGNESLTGAAIHCSAASASSLIPTLISAKASAGQITVKWSALSGASKYAVYRKAAGDSSWTRLTNAVTGTSYTDKSSDLKAGTTYYYTVRAYIGSAWGSYDTAGVSAKAVAANYPVLTSATASAGQINVKWNAFSGASKYAVYRKAAGESSWTRLTNTVTGTSYTDKSSDLKAGTTYYYTVRAYVGSAWGSYDSKGVSAKAK